MTYIGDFVSGANIVRKFTTRDFSTGAPFNLANANVVAYKDGNATAFTTGLTLTTSYNNRVGMHEIVVNALNTTRYTSGNEYDVILDQGTTVNSVNVGNEVIISFSIENRGVKQAGSVTNNVTVGTIANNAINSLSFDKAAGSFFPTGIVDQGIAQAAAAGNITLRSAAVFGCNEIVGAMVVVENATAGIGQTRQITAYNGNTKVANVDAWTTTPTGNIVYKLFAGPPAPSTPPDVRTVDITANVVKEFFNLNSGTNYQSSVAGSVVNEILAGSGTVNLNVQSIIDRLNSNVIVASVVANVNTQFVANNGIFAASLNANAITGAKVANDVDIRNVNGNVAGTVGSVTGNVGNVTGNLGGTVVSVINLNAQLVDAAITSRATGAQVKSNVVAALATDTYAEPGQGTPGATTDLATKIGYMYKLSRNKIVQNATQMSVYSNNGAAIDHKATVSDDGNNFTRGELATGP